MFLYTFVSAENKRIRGSSREPGLRTVTRRLEESLCRRERKSSVDYDTQGASRTHIVFLGQAPSRARTRSGRMLDLSKSKGSQSSWLVKRKMSMAQIGENVPFEPSTTRENIPCIPGLRSEWIETIRETNLRPRLLKTKRPRGMRFPTSQGMPVFRSTILL